MRPKGGELNPYRFKSLADAYKSLKPGITFEQLDAASAKMGDNDAALAMNNARRKLFQAVSVAMKKQA